jgi:hypothetical protein
MGAYGLCSVPPVVVPPVVVPCVVPFWAGYVRVPFFPA